MDAPRSPAHLMTARANLKWLLPARTLRSGLAPWRPAWRQHAEWSTQRLPKSNEEAFQRGRTTPARTRRRSARGEDIRQLPPWQFGVACLNGVYDCSNAWVGLISARASPCAPSSGSNRIQKKTSSRKVPLLPPGIKA
jgi:hypothetical protein